MEGSVDRETQRGQVLPTETAECLAQRSDLWIFAYGSLMWDPGFVYAEAQPALLKGYHRSFCVYSRRHAARLSGPAWCLDSTAVARARVSPTACRRPTWLRRCIISGIARCRV